MSFLQSANQTSDEMCSGHTDGAQPESTFDSRLTVTGSEGIQDGDTVAQRQEAGDAVTLSADVAVELPIDNDEDSDEEDEKLAGSVRGDSDDEGETDSSKPHRRTGALQIKPSALYENRNKVADFMGFTALEFDRMLLTNDMLLDVARLHRENYIKVAPGTKPRARDIPHEDIVAMLGKLEESNDESDLLRLSNPSASDVNGFTEKEHLMRHICMAKQVLSRTKIFMTYPRMDARTKFEWGYLLLKTREVLDTNRRKMQQAESAYKTRTEETQRRADQERRRPAVTSKDSSNNNTQGSAPSSGKGKEKALGSARKPSHGEPKYSSKASVNTDEEGDPRHIVNIGRRKDAALNSVQRVDDVSVDPRDVAQLAQDMEDAHIETLSHEKVDEVARALSLERAKQHALSSIQIACSQDRRGKTYRQIARALEQSIDDFYDDFVHLPVANHRARSMTSCPSSVKIKPSDMTNFDPTTSNDGPTQRGDVQTTETVLEALTREDASARQVDEQDPRMDPNKDYGDEDSPAATAAAAHWHDILNSGVFQIDDLKSAMRRCYIADADRPRLPHQNVHIRLRWWQLLCIYWSTLVLKKGYTKGGLIGDMIGLGKTFEYVGMILLDTYERSLEYNDAPEDDKPECKPWIIVTLSSVLAQTAAAVRDFSDHLRVVIVSTDSGIRGSLRAVEVIPSIDRNHYLRNTKHELNLRTVVLVSYHTASNQWGPTAVAAWARRQNKTALSADDIAFHSKFPTHVRGLFRGLIADEAHFALRNESKFSRTLQWMDAAQVWLFSGSPSLRGPSDFANYLTLFELPRARDLATDGDDKLNYKPNRTNPYDLPDDHEGAICRHTSFAMKKWVADEATKGNATVAGASFQLSARHWLLSRNYESACPIGSDRKIAANLPPLRHLATEVCMRPSMHRLYMEGFEDWRSRLMIPTDENSKDPMPNPRAIRALAILGNLPWLKVLHLPNPDFIPSKVRQDMDDIPDDALQTDQDYCSIFNEKSALSQAMPLPGPHFRLTRRLLSSARDKGLRAFGEKDFTDTTAVKDAKIRQIVLSSSPKAAYAMFEIMRVVLLGDRRITVWFEYAFNRGVFWELLLSFGFFDALTVFQVGSDTETSYRQRIFGFMDDPNHTIRVLLINAGTGGTGTNLQKYCSDAILYEALRFAADEGQIIGRHHRLGASRTVVVHSLSVAGTHDAKMLSKMIANSLAGVAAMMSHTGPVKEATGQDPGETQDSGETQDTTQRYMSRYFWSEDPSGERKMYHLDTQSGREQLKRLRDAVDGPSDGRLPTMVEPDVALQHLLEEARAHRIVRHVGFTDAANLSMRPFVVREIIETMLAEWRTAIVAEHISLGMDHSPFEIFEDGISSGSNVRHSLLSLDSDHHGIPIPAEDVFWTMNRATRDKIKAVINQTAAENKVPVWKGWIKPAKTVDAGDAEAGSSGTRKSKRIQSNKRKNQSESGPSSKKAK